MDSLRHALEARYDGPLPLHASAPADWAQPLAVQRTSRRRWAWAEVKRLGRRSAAARRALRHCDGNVERVAWTRARSSLAQALRTWSYFRNGQGGGCSARQSSTQR